MTAHRYDSDYGDDYFRWIKILTLYPSIARNKLQRQIIASNDFAMAYFFAIEFAYQPHLMRKMILDSQDPKYAFLFARDVPNADIKALQKVVIASEHSGYIYKFACFVKGADTKRLEKLISQSKNAKAAHTLLKNVKGSDVKKFKKVIMASGKPRYLFELAKHVSSRKEVSQIEDLIIKSGSMLYIRLFACKIKRANIEKLERAVLDTEDVENIKKFAKAVKGSKMRRFFLIA